MMRLFKGRSSAIKEFVRNRYSQAFDYVYSPHGFEHRLAPYVRRQARTEAEKARQERESAVISNPLTRLTSFVGLPNYCPVGKQQSWSNIGKNLIGWQDDVALGRKIVNGLKAPFALLWNLVFIIPTFVMNIVRLATEYLPLLGLAYCQDAMVACRVKIHHLKRFTHQEPVEKAAIAGYVALYTLAALGAVVTGSLYFVGQAITSPIQGVRSAWKFGHDLFDRVKNPTAKKVLGRIFGGFFAVLSAAVTVTFYTILFPLAINAIATAIAGQSVPVISSAVSAVTNAAPSWLTSVGNAVVMPVLGKVFSALGATAAPAAAGISFLVSAAVATVGVGIERAVNKFKSVWRASGAGNSMPPVVAEATGAAVVPGSDIRIARELAGKRDAHQSQLLDEPSCTKARLEEAARKAAEAAKKAEQTRAALQHPTQSIAVPDPACEKMKDDAAKQAADLACSRSNPVSGRFCN